MRRVDSLLITLAIVAAAMLSAACTRPVLKDELIRPEPGYARPPATEGSLAETANRITARHGPQASGFMVLDDSRTSFEWRLALIDAAVSSLDIQTYIWYPDNAGRLLLERAVRAAQRGVRVRLIVDDLLTIGLDQTIAELERHPNIEFRLFNPWKGRRPGARLGEMLAEMERLNIRMHNKLVIADGVAAIMGGRNIGDHYFGIAHAFNFHDLDVLGFGPVAQQASNMFDHFWNSEWVVSAQNLTVEPVPEFAAAAWDQVRRKNREAEELAAFPREPADWSAALKDMEKTLRIGTSVVTYDEATGKEISQNMGTAMFSFLSRAEEELLVTNAYIIPGERGIELIRRLSERGVRVRILTNSLASHDVPAVNSHYKEWRRRALRAACRCADQVACRCTARARRIRRAPYQGRGRRPAPRVHRLDELRSAVKKHQHRGRRLHRKPAARR